MTFSSANWSGDRTKQTKNRLSRRRSDMKLGYTTPDFGSITLPCWGPRWFLCLRDPAIANVLTDNG